MDNKTKIIEDLITENEIFSAREQFLDDQHNCPLCGSEMLITHVTQFVELKTKEEAHCEACKIQVRTLEHVLQ